MQVYISSLYCLVFPARALPLCCTIAGCRKNAMLDCDTGLHQMQDNFDEWGPVERIYNVASKTIAFVQYYWRASAEFAKEAMQVRQ